MTLMERQLDKIPGYDSLDSNSMDVYLNLVKQGVKQHILAMEKKEGKDVNLDAINIDSNSPHNHSNRIGFVLLVKVHLVSW